MAIKIIEIKAKSKTQEKVRDLLLANDAAFKGEDHQIDTYFNVANGRLKLREGNIENNLIHYIRENKNILMFIIFLNPLRPTPIYLRLLMEAYRLRPLRKMHYQ